MSQLAPIIYGAEINASAVTTATDLFQITPVADRPVVIYSLVLAQTTSNWPVPGCDCGLRWYSGDGVRLYERGDQQRPKCRGPDLELVYQLGRDFDRHHPLEYPDSASVGADPGVEAEVVESRG
jgi:hypothetical protein